MSTPLPSAAPPAGVGVVLMRLAGSALAVVLVGGATFGVVTRFFHQHRTETTVYSDVRSVSVDTEVGDIDVRAGRPGTPVTLTRHLSWSFGTPTSTETATGGALTARARCGQALGIGSCSVAYDLTVPPEVPLTLESNTGTVRAEGIAGDVKATTATGSVELRDLRSRQVEAHSSTGSVEVALAAAPDSVRADTSTGSVEVEVPRDATAYAVSASTSTGGTEVTVPVDSRSARRIEARTSTGSVEVRPATP